MGGHRQWTAPGSRREERDGGARHERRTGNALVLAPGFELENQDRRTEPPEGLDGSFVWREKAGLEPGELDRRAKQGGSDGIR